MSGNYDTTARQEIADIELGCRVDRAAALVITGTNPLFTITGGRVLLLNFVGEIMVDIAATATTMRISALTTDATAVVTHLTSAVTDINALAAGRMLTLPAAVASDLILSVGSSAAVSNTQVPIVLKTGALNLIAGASPATGTIRWSAFYIPIDDGAYMTAA